MGLLCGEGCVLLTSTVFDWSTRVSDRQTDGQTDGRWHIARYSICCRALKTSSTGTQSLSECYAAMTCYTSEMRPSVSLTAENLVLASSTLLQVPVPVPSTTRLGYSMVYSAGVCYTCMWWNFVLWWKITVLVFIDLCDCELRCREFCSCHKHKLHYFDLLRICCTSSCTTNPQHLDMSLDLWSTQQARRRVGPTRHRACCVDHNLLYNKKNPQQIEVVEFRLYTLATVSPWLRSAVWRVIGSWSRLTGVRLWTVIILQTLWWEICDESIGH